MGGEQPFGEDERARVVAAVHDELGRWGIDRFNVAAMAHRHGLDVDQIRRHWPDAESLILEALADRPGDHAPLPDTGSLREDMFELALRMAQLLDSESGRRLHGGHLIADTEFADVELRRNAWRARAARLSPIFERARVRGEMRDGVESTLVLELLFAPINMRALYTGEAVDDEYCRTVSELVFHAVTP